MGAARKVNIRPGVSVLSVLQHLNYRSWYALAEFVDNSVQSFLAHRQELGGDHARLAVTISLDPSEPQRMTIRDNAAGIGEGDYARAFRPAEVPPDRSGLSEFGMGMKSAACWFAPKWRVRTCALGEGTEKTVSFDIATIVRDSIEELSVEAGPVGGDQHFTEVELLGLYRPIHTKTRGKIRDHLASIYRMFLRDGTLALTFDGELLSYETPRVLTAPFYRDPKGPSIQWRKEIDFDFGGGYSVRGFAALRERASTSRAGLALFRRRRLIQGSADDGYRPEIIFGKSNSYRFQRLFGELELEGFSVSHTKDGFAWDENEEAFLELLREELNSGSVPLLAQAEEYRVRPSKAEIQDGAETATDRTAQAIERELPPALEAISGSLESADLPPELPSDPVITKRVIDVSLNGVSWQIHLELSNDPALGGWVEVFDAGTDGGTAPSPRRVGIRMALAHPFVERFGGTTAERLEPLIRIAAALGLAEVAARDSGVKKAGTIRMNVNTLLREGLSKP